LVETGVSRPVKAEEAKAAIHFGSRQKIIEMIKYEKGLSIDP